jgi:signal transduction histidine kinase
VDRQFVASVGAIVVGSMLRQRVIEADQAKLRFVGHVSHELRTPLHGCTSQIDLIREFASPQELRKLAPLLDAADVCLESLSDVLNDTLDFSKLNNTSALSANELAAQQMRALTPTDLHSLVEGVTKSVWVRKRRVDVVTADVDHYHARNAQDKVDLILEVEERDTGWRAMADVGGLKR